MNNLEREWVELERERGVRERNRWGKREKRDLRENEWNEREETGLNEEKKNSIRGGYDVRGVRN